LPVFDVQNTSFPGTLRVVLALEKSILASFRTPAGRVLSAARNFFELIGQLIELLTSREADGSSILAERLNALEFPGPLFRR
jgi:hypothetical protein